MVQEAFKNQYLSSHELYQAKRWEGKPLGFKLKYLVANYPELALATFGFAVLFPAILTFRYLTFNEEKSMALRKYKQYYTGKKLRLMQEVVRHDDPNIADIIKEKECGRQYFPQ